MLNKKNEKLIDYEYLSPRDDVEIKEKEALDFAFKNPKVKNIAITGEYSSGKSTIIQSYIKSSKIKNAITISLATFQENNTETSVEIEKSIIEKLYYATYIRRMEYRKSFSLLLGTVGYLVLLCYLLMFNLKFAFFIQAIKDYKLCGIFFIWCVSIGIVIGLSKLCDSINKISKYSIKLEKFEVEVGNTNNVINENLESLINIFRDKNIKYVIFEDLDRFNKTIIFEHLRELNNILNNNIVNVKFIYLVKDNIFQGEKRTKFFDFIYPVIPFVSYGSSGNEFNKIIEKYVLDDELSKDFVNDIGVYINDIRILKNALNEFRIYKSSLENYYIDSKVLFSMILYKNIFPKDFIELQENEGFLYNFIKLEDKIKNEEIGIIKRKISLIDCEISKNVSISSAKVKEYKREKEIYINQIRRIKMKSLKELCNSSTSVLSAISDYGLTEKYEGLTKKQEEKDLILYLIKNGYLNEDYLIYISRFQPYGLSKRDLDFFIALKVNGNLDLNYKLDDSQQLVKKISKKDFKSKAIINIRNF